MKLHKHNNRSFTLITHDKRIYSLDQQGDNGFASNYCGKAGEGYIPGGTLLRHIPDFLKNKCFNLNRKL